jgi:hypothetical protein
MEQLFEQQDGYHHREDYTTIGQGQGGWREDYQF